MSTNYLSYPRLTISCSSYIDEYLMGFLPSKKGFPPPSHQQQFPFLLNQQTRLDHGHTAPPKTTLPLTSFCLYFKQYPLFKTSSIRFVHSPFSRLKLPNVTRGRFTATLTKSISTFPAIFSARKRARTSALNRSPQLYWATSPNTILLIT